MLVSMDCISAKQKLDFVFTAIFGGDGDSKILESFCELFPVGYISFAESLHVFFILDKRRYFG